jgi:hypothetical protein
MMSEREFNASTVRTFSRRSAGQSQRDCIAQPRVARNELPWVNKQTVHQPQRGCSVRHSFPRDATPLGLKPFFCVVPRVAPSSQPSANGWNHVGILATSALSKN